MGGVNTWTPIRPFVPTYYDSPLLSDDINEIREHYKLDCGEHKYHSVCKDFCLFVCVCVCGGCGCV